MRLRRFMAVILSASIIFSTVVPAHATARGIDDQVIEHIVVPFNTMMVRGIESIGDMLDAVQQEGFDFIRNVYDFWSGLIYDGILDYRGFVDGLDYTTVTHDGLFSVFPGGWYMAANDYLNPAGVSSYNGGFTFSGSLLTASGSYVRYTRVYSSEFNLPKGVYNLSLDCASGFYSTSSTRWGKYYEVYISGLKDGVWTNITSVGNNGSSNYPYTAVVSLTSDYDALRLFSEVRVETNRAVGYACAAERTVHLDCTELIGTSSSPDSTSRLSALANSLNQYNLQNSIQDNDMNVNFVLVPVDVEPSLDTSISPALYDEEELVYTDPVTGTEYLTNGWTYDYLTRCYTLDMADGFTIGDAAIDTIKLTYGDELLTVDHYSDGALIRSDEYNYVMASGSECALNGHTNVITDTQDPTCTAAGHRTYTCSVCGNQYVEDIPQNDHAYGEFTVEQEATCTAPGITSFTCTTCGGQYIDTISSLGHDWQPTQRTEESYVMPDHVFCPDCLGEDFTYVRKELELRTGKNLFDMSKITVQEPPESGFWISEVGENYFVVSRTSDLLSSNRWIFHSPFKFKDIAPAVIPGLTYAVSIESDGQRCFGISNRFLYNGLSYSFSEDDLNSELSFYFDSDLSLLDVKISNIQLELGSRPTPFEPYDAEYLEIIPPLYIFTCSNPECGSSWTVDAEYQGATITYTCTRCSEIRTEEVGEESGLFHSIGNLIADGITWATDKMTQLVDSIAGLNDIFTDFAESVKNSAGQYPAFLGAVIALLPEDLMNVFWFGIVALIIIAVWKKWFS